MDFKIKTITRDKEGHYIMIKGSIQEDTIILNIYTPNRGAPQYIRLMLMTIKGETDSNTIIVGDCNTPSHQKTDHPDRKLVGRNELQMIHWTSWT